MHWLASSKVRLALIVNGLYFISLFTTPSPRHARPRFFAQARQQVQARRAAEATQPGYVPLPPPTAPSSASAYESGGMLHVSLDKDLTLVKKPGRTVLLLPSFGASKVSAAGPESVLLNFIIYSDKEACPGDCPLTINADGVTVWTSYSFGAGWQRERAPGSSSTLADGSVVETLAAESLSTNVKYDNFIDIISARRVIIRLGSDRVELTADQIEALRDMHRRLPQPPPPDDSDY
ncbi:MAG TPA: hypothetical protein VF591_08550 [Pyrinomonadaceae bacterium]|jgi:hypothetical protein